MKLSATVQAVSAFGICAAIAVSAVYVTKSAAQSAKERQPKAGTNAAPIYGVTIPAGYRDWHLIAVSRLVGGKSDNMAVFEGHMAHNQLRALLGNDIAAKAFREGKRPFPDGAMIAALHWNEGSSDENDKVLAMGFPGAGLQSSVPEFRCECSIHGQELKKIRGDGRLGICRLHQRQTRRRGAAPNLLALPSARQGPRLRLHALRAYTMKSRGRAKL